jgi:hypothetical protein
VTAATTAAASASLPRATMAPEMINATAVANKMAEAKGDFINRSSFDAIPDEAIPPQGELTQA